MISCLFYVTLPLLWAINSFNLQYLSMLQARKFQYQYVGLKDTIKRIKQNVDRIAGYPHVPKYLFQQNSPKSSLIFYPTNVYDLEQLAGNIPLQIMSTGIIPMLIRVLKKNHNQRLFLTYVGYQQCKLSEQGKILLFNFYSAAAGSTNAKDVWNGPDERHSNRAFISSQFKRGHQITFDGEKADLYGLGIMILYLLTGKIPFIDSDDLSIIKIIDKQKNKSFWGKVRQKDPDDHYCSKIKNLVQSLLKRQPDKRPTLQVLQQWLILTEAQTEDVIKKYLLTLNQPKEKSQFTFFSYKGGETMN